MVHSLLSTPTDMLRKYHLPTSTPDIGEQIIPTSKPASARLTRRVSRWLRRLSSLTGCSRDSATPATKVLVLRDLGRPT